MSEHAAMSRRYPQRGIVVDGRRPTLPRHVRQIISPRAEKEVRRNDTSWNIVPISGIQARQKRANGTLRGEAVRVALVPVDMVLPKATSLGEQR